MSNTNTRDALAARRTTATNGASNGNGRGAYENRSNQSRPNQPPPPVAVTPHIPDLDDRAPTGAVPWPFILLEGGEKTGKGWDLAVLSSSPRVGRSWTLDLSEGGGDEYGAIPGARYRVLNHDGTWRTIMGQIRAVRREAENDREQGKPPVCLFIDSGSLIWNGLSQWAEQLARRSPAGQKKIREALLKDPGTDPASVDITVQMTHWNAANKRWRTMMTILLTFPGIVVMTARGKYVASIDENGKPIQGTKEYKVEGQKDLCFDATVWVRKNRDGSTEIIGARSVHAGIRPGGDQPHKVRNGGFTLDWLIFDALRCDPDAAHVRDLKHLDGTTGEAHEEAEQEKARASVNAGLVDPATRRDVVPAVSDPSPLEAPADEDEALLFAQYSEAVVTIGTTRDKIHELWGEGRTNHWLDRTMPGRQDSPRHLMTTRARVLAEMADGEDEAYQEADQRAAVSAGVR